MTDDNTDPESDAEPVVLEVKASAELTAHLALDDGDDPAGAVRAALADCDAIRTVDELALDEVYTIERW